MSDDTRTDSGKNIVVFCDGTGQEGGVGNNTNVYKLFNMIEDRTQAQIAFYDQGIGTSGNRLKKLKDNLTGAGITKDILQCYQFISDNYLGPDELFLFGFSRGATTVRSLAGFISLFGILPHSRPDLVRQAWDIYRIQDVAKRKASAAAFLQRNHTTYCNIKFLGVWDSVAALGLPGKTGALLGRIPAYKHEFHDLELSSRVQHAYHALAIDDEREAFHPMPWRTIDKNGKSLLGQVPIDPRKGDLEDLESQDRRQTVEQVWFCGVHTDVGGGYKESGVSNIPLAWMIDKATEHGLRLYPFHGVDLEADIEDVIHDSIDVAWKRVLFKRKLRSWDPSLGKPVIHASVLERKRGKAGAEDKPYKPWILQQENDLAEPELRQYEIAPWDNRGDTLRYGMNIENLYRTEYDAARG